MHNGNFLLIHLNVFQTSSNFETFNSYYITRLITSDAKNVSLIYMIDEDLYKLKEKIGKPETQKYKTEMKCKFPFCMRI